MIEEIGEGVKDFKVGDFVVVPFTHGCRHSKFYSSGFEANCPNAIGGVNGGDYQREYYQAIDAEELALETCLRKKRNTQTAYAFLKRIRNSGAIMSDKAPSIPSDFKKLPF